jgi:nitrogen fixation protein FixH
LIFRFAKTWLGHPAPVNCGTEVTDTEVTDTEVTDTEVTDTEVTDTEDTDTEDTSTENTTMNQSIAIENKEKTAQLLWTGFILVFFIVQAIIWMVAISITIRDPSHAVVAGYDEKALKWDEEKALSEASAHLGWQAEILIDSSADILGNHAITVKLDDRDQSPVDDAKIELRAFHRALAGKPQQISLSEINEGVYTGQIQIRKSGLWQFEGVARKGEQTFLIDQRLSLEVRK